MVEMRKLLLALETYQAASLRLHEIRLKGDADVYAEQHRDDSMDEFGKAMDEYVDQRIEKALEEHNGGFMHNGDSDGY